MSASTHGTPRCVLALSLLALALVFAGAPASAADRTLVIRGARLIDGTGAPARENVAIVIEGDRIAAVVDDAKVSVPPNAEIVPAAGRTVMPGLIDAHVHMRNDLAELFLAFGITTVRDAGNFTDWVVELKKKQAAGELRGPRLFAAGGIVDAPPPQRPHHLPVATPEAAREIARQLLAKGMDAIKVYTKLTPELLRPIAEAANDAGKPVMGHITMSARDAALAGIDSLEHVSGVAIATATDPDKVKVIPDQLGVFGFRYMDRAKADDLIKLLIEKRVTVTPSLASWARATPRRMAFQAEGAKVLANRDFVYATEELRQRVRDYVRAFSPEQKAGYEQDLEALKIFLGRYKAAGGRLVVGTDGGAMWGLSVHHEMQLLVDMGLSPMEALIAATRDAAAVIRAKDLGTIEPGKLADLLVLDGDPLRGIENTRKIRMVIQGGRIADTSFHRDYRIPVERP